jgi:hypothetical protein
MRKDFPSFLTCIFYIFPFFTPGRQPYFEISEMTTHTPMNRARDIWWTLDFASAFLSPGVNSRGELVPSHGASRCRLGDNSKRLIIGGPTASPSKSNISAQICRTPKQKFDYIFSQRFLFLNNMVWS